MLASVNEKVLVEAEDLIAHYIGCCELHSIEGIESMRKKTFELLWPPCSRPSIAINF